MSQTISQFSRFFVKIQSQKPKVVFHQSFFSQIFCKSLNSRQTMFVTKISVVKKMFLINHHGFDNNIWKKFLTKHNIINEEKLILISIGKFTVERCFSSYAGPWEPQRGEGQGGPALSPNFLTTKCFCY